MLLSSSDYEYEMCICLLVSGDGEEVGDLGRGIELTYVMRKSFAFNVQNFTSLGKAIKVQWGISEMDFVARPSHKSRL